MVRKKKRKSKIRVIALAVILKDDHIFVTEYKDPDREDVYYRPLGGGVDFGELGEQTVRRELMEEIEAELIDVVYLGLLENIFKNYAGEGHQICLMYSAIFAESHRSDLTYTVTGQEGQSTFFARWMPLDHFRTGKSDLYPNGLLDLLDKASS